jgi:hypothetical protein
MSRHRHDDAPRLPTDSPNRHRTSLVVRFRRAGNLPSLEAPLSHDEIDVEIPLYLDASGEFALRIDAVTRGELPTEPPQIPTREAIELSKYVVALMGRSSLLRECLDSAQLYATKAILELESGGIQPTAKPRD